MPDPIREWLLDQGSAGQIALACLDLPSAPPYYLSRAARRAVEGLHELGRRDLPLASHIAPVVAVLEQLLTFESDARLSEAFRPITAVSWSASPSHGVQKSNPWFSAIIAGARESVGEELLAAPVGAGCLATFFSLGTQFPLAPYGTLLRQSLESAADCAKLAKALTDIQCQERITKLGLDGLARQANQVRIRLQSQAPISKASLFWARYASLLGAIARHVEKIDLLPGLHSFPRDVRVGLSVLRETEDDLPAHFLLAAEPPTKIAYEDTEGAQDLTQNTIAGLSSDTPASRRPPSAPRALSEAAISWSRLVEERSLLPMSWSRLSESEINAIRERLLSSDPEWSSAAVAEVYGALMLGGVDEGNPRRHTLKFPRPPASFLPNEQEKALYRPCLDQITLSLEEKDHPPVAQSTGSIATARELLSELRRHTCARVHEGRIGRALAGKLLDVTGDITLVHGLFPKTDPTIQGSIYYAGFSINRLRKLLAEVAKISVLTSDDVSDEAVIGSAGVPRLNCYREHVESLQAKLKKTLKEASASLRERHNLFVAYTTLLFLQTSGHRFVSDPFHDPCLLIAPRGMALAADKAEMPSHLMRFVPFGEIARQQFKLYYLHLRGLAQDLKQDGHALGAAVSIMLEMRPDGAPAVDGTLPLPFLFFISPDFEMERVTFKSFQEVVGDWPWHRSAHRHLLSTMLREADIPAEYVDHVFGHWALGESPSGAWSLLAPEDFIKPIVNALDDQILPRLGLYPISGLRPHRPKGSRRPEAKRVGQTRAAATVAALHGPLLRRTHRERVSSDDEAVVSRCWNEAMAAANVSIDEEKIPDIVAKQARLSILERSGDCRDRVAARLMLLRQRTLELRDSGKDIVVTGTAYSLQDDPPPIDDLSGQRLARVSKIREELAKLIEVKAEKLSSPSCPVEVTCATSLMSAIVFGGLRRDLWSPFISAIQSRYFRFEGTEWLLLDDGSGKRRRYIGDGVTRLLYSLAARRLAGSAYAPPPGGPARDTVSLTSKLEDSKESSLLEKRVMDETKKILELLDASLSLAELAGGMADDLAARVSGVTLAHLRGTLQCSDLPNLAFARLISGRCLSDGSPVSAGDAFERKPPDRSHSSSKVCLESSHDLLEELRQVLSKADSSQSAASQGRSLRNSEKRARLRKEIAALRSKVTSATAPVADQYLRFSESLLSAGGERGHLLAPSTLRKYIAPNALPLLESFSSSDPRTLDEGERAELYDIALGPRSPFNDGRAGRAESMRRFDRYLCQEYALEPLAWEEIEPSIFQSDGQVSANLISIPDVHRLLELDHQRLTMPASVARWFPGLPRMQALCGLRISEAWRLMPEDEQVDQVVVRANRNGSLKTPGSRRRAPDFGKSLNLYAEEHNVPRTPRTSLEDPSSRHEVAAAAALAYRLASGDPTIRPHHGRHGFGSNQLLLLSGISHPLILKALSMEHEAFSLASAGARKQLSSRPHVSTRAIPALTMAMGHALHAGYDGTTLSTYTHVLDVLAAAELDRHAPRLSTESVARLAGVKSVTLRSALHRRAQSSPRGYTPPSAKGRVGHRVTGAEVVTLLGGLRRVDVGLESIRDAFVPGGRTQPRGQALGPAEFLKIVDALQRGTSVAEVAAANRISKQKIRKTINAAARIPTGHSVNIFGLRGCAWVSGDQERLLWESGILYRSSRTKVERLLRSFESEATWTEVLRLSETLGQKTIDHAALDQICATFRGDKEWSTHSPMVMDDLVRVATSLGLGCVAGRVNPGSGLQTLRIQGPPPLRDRFHMRCGARQQRVGAWARPEKGRERLETVKD